MQKYREILRIADFRRLWIGSTLSLLGDGASWTAMAWLAVMRGGAGALAVLGLSYTAPIVLGGLLAGLVVDRLPRRALLIADSTVRGAVMACVPLLALAGHLHMWHLYAVATISGLLKILPIGIIPAVIPDLVPPDRVTTGIALESIAQGVSGLAGPAVGGALIPLIGAPQVLALDAASFLLFPLLVLRMDSRLPKPATGDPSRDSSASSWRPVLRLLRRDPVLLGITLAFSSLNVGAGILMVLQPWLAHDKLAGGPRILGLLVATLAGAELVGSFAAGTVRPARRPMLRIGLLQVAAGAGLFLFLGANLAAILVGQLICGVATTLATVSSQAVRLARTPPELWARTMTLMRTILLGALPVGSVLAGPLLAAGHYPAAVLLMALITAVPGALVALLTGSSVRTDTVLTPSSPPPATNPPSPAAARPVPGT